jgi:membrane-bound serine protease (ClpP class)
VILAIALLLAGLVLVVAEVFFPSLGAFGIAAAVCVVAADWVAYRESGPTAMWILIGIQLVAIPAVLKLAFWALPRTPFGRGMLLPAPPPEPRSGVEASEHLLGREGVALTDLRPGGTAEVGGERRSVVAETGSLDRGTPLVVVAVEGYRVVVRPRT